MHHRLRPSRPSSHKMRQKKKQPPVCRVSKQHLEDAYLEKQTGRKKERQTDIQSHKEKETGKHTARKRERHNIVTADEHPPAKQPVKASEFVLLLPSRNFSRTGQADQTRSSGKLCSVAEGTSSRKLEFKQVTQ